MKSLLFSSLSLFALVLTTGLSSPERAYAQSIDDITLNVYKEETCGCCVGWIAHMDERGFDSTVFHPTNIYTVKEELGRAAEVAVLPHGSIQGWLSVRRSRPLQNTSASF